ncbi:MAG: BrnT family toxin [Puniceicoccaceae bacterium]
MNYSFEYDPEKSLRNREKHGIDFEEARSLWEGRTTETHLEFPEEQRYLTVGQIRGKFWSAIITYRHEKIRIISIRRSRAAEIHLWQQHH